MVSLLALTDVVCLFGCAPDIKECLFYHTIMYLVQSVSSSPFDFSGGRLCEPVLNSWLHLNTITLASPQKISKLFLDGNENNRDWFI
jgi:hypothetical protein